MKRILNSVVLATILGMVLTFAACTAEISEADEETTLTSKSVMSETTESKEKALLQLTEVKFENGVSEADIGISISARQNMLVSRLEAKTGKYISPAESMIDDESLVNIIEEKKKSLNLPNFLDPTEEDIAKIKEKFPGLSEAQIAENIESIIMIYQDELSALILDTVIANSTAKGSDTPYVQEEEEYESDASRSVWKKAKKIIFGTKDHASHAVENVAGKVESKVNQVQKKLVTIYEVSTVLKYPFSAPAVFSVKNIAVSYTSKYMGGSGESTRDKGDAFRHAVFAVALAKEAWGTKTMKYKWAKDFTEAHEKGINYSKYSSEMDLHNNVVGLNTISFQESFWNQSRNFAKRTVL